MLKRLVMLGLLVLVNGAWSQIPGNGSGQHDKAQDKQETANPSKPVVVVDSQHGANNQKQAPEKPTKYPWGELLAPANIPNWFLVAVGVVTGWFVYKTLRAIKKQADIMETGAKDARESGAEATRIALATAKAARASADAANAQIKMMKDKERARVDVEIQRIDILNLTVQGRNPITLKFRNLGLTRAFSFRAEADARPVIEAFAPQPFEFVDLVLPAVLDTSHAADTWVGCIFPEEWYDELLLLPRMTLQVRGVMQYEDVFGDKHSEEFGWDMRISKLIATNKPDVFRIHEFSQWYGHQEQQQNPNPN
jgi:hypothetical protein